VYRAKARAWIEWALEQPWSTGPVVDEDGHACAQGQSGNTWFLAGTAGGAVQRSCTIPHGKKLFFPLLDYWVAARAENVDTDEELQHYLDFVAGWFESQHAATCSLTLRIDGQDLLPDFETMDEELFAQELDPFPVELQADNFGTGPAGTRTTTTAGHWALLHPLPPGDYVLELGGAQCDDDDEVIFETSATYALHVQHHGE
jgi:hypothetical protein